MNILITGGASGLGASITRVLAQSGADNIYFTFNKSRESAAEIEKQYPNARAIHCDFFDDQSLNHFVDSIAALKLDVLVNNAMTGLSLQHFHRTRPEQFVDGFRYNVMPTLRITQAALQGFRKKKAGKIITILTSFVVNVPPVGLSEYVAAKAYLLSMSRSWAGESARHNITANCISPSMMHTALTASIDERQVEEMTAGSATGTLLTPAEVANTVAFFVAAGPHVNGVNFLMNGAHNVI